MQLIKNKVVTIWDWSKLSKKFHILSQPHKVRPNTRVRTKLALVFIYSFLLIESGNFYAAFFFLYSAGDK